MRLPKFKLEVYLAQREFTARHYFCGSDLESRNMTEILEMADEESRELWNNLSLGYSETSGHPVLRDEIAKLYKDANRENVLCFAGAQEGINCAAQAILQPGDHAIVFTPCYQSLETIPASICDVTRIELDFDKGWAMDINQVENAIQPNTKMILINFPHNPTGTLISAETQKQLVDIARRADAYIFSDEVYRLLEHDERDRVPPIASVYEKGLSLSVMSKSYGLAGLRIGWIASQDTDLLKKMADDKHYMSICNSNPSEILSLIALRSADRILERNHNLMRENLRPLSAFFNDASYPFEWVEPKGGCIAFPRYTGKLPLKQFVDGLEKEEGVVVLPAEVYDYPKKNFRVSFGRKDMPQSLEHFKAFVDRHKPSL